MHNKIVDEVYQLINIYNQFKFFIACIDFILIISLDRITNSELEPLQAQLSELDQSIADQLDAIAAVKANIIRNDEKTNKMLSSVAFSRWG